MEPYRIVIADDHVLFLQGMKKIIEPLKGVEVIGEARDGLELLKLLNKVTPDMVILDISMPNLRGIEVTREIKSREPGVKVLILTVHKEKDYVHHCIAAGADGYLLKEDADADLFAAIKNIRSGHVYVSPILQQNMTDDIFQIFRGEFSQSPEPLTPREREVVKLVAEGKKNKEIASLLYISIRTVEHHRANIMHKLKLKNASELVKYAIRKGYVTS